MASNVNVIKVTLKQYDNKLDNILKNLDLELAFRAKKYKIPEEECCSFDAMHEIEGNLKLVKDEFNALKTRRDAFIQENEAITAELENKVEDLSINLKKIKT